MESISWEAFEYILRLKNPSGETMHTSRRKTGFIGFLVAIKSIQLIFNELDTTVENNHIHSLVTNIGKIYSKIRLYHLGKEKTQNQCGQIVRKKLNELVLFKHQ